MSLSIIISSLLLLLPTLSIPITKNAYLTPSNEDSGNGATITRLGNGLYVDSSGSTQYWELDVNNNRGFNLQLSLDDTWGFHPTLTTKLIISIDSDDLYCWGDPSNCDVGQDILVAFTQNGVSQYIATAVQFDLSHNNFIYPACDKTSPYTQSFASGNVKSLIDAFNNGRDRAYKISQGQMTWDDITTVKRTIKFPFSFILQNIPSSNYMVLRFVNDGVYSSCAFVEMSPDIGMDIYFSSEDVNDVSFQMKAINVTHIYDTISPSPTDYPSTNPTVVPTVVPTVIPTNFPTMHPSVIPLTSASELPSKSPTTISPTNVPSEVPSNTPTPEPTYVPSQDPTNTPSFNPTKNSVSSTVFPSHSPTSSFQLEIEDIPETTENNSVTAIPSTSHIDETNHNITDGNTDDLDQNDESMFSPLSSSRSVLWILCIVVMIMCLCCWLLTIAAWMRHKRNKIEEMKDTKNTTIKLHKPCNPPSSLQHDPESRKSQKYTPKGTSHSNNKPKLKDQVSSNSVPKRDDDSNLDIVNPSNIPMPNILDIHHNINDLQLANVPNLPQVTQGSYLMEDSDSSSCIDHPHDGVLSGHKPTLISYTSGTMEATNSVEDQDSIGYHEGEV